MYLETNWGREIGTVCMRVLGDLLYANERLCTHIVCEKKEELQLISNLQA